MTLQTKIMVVMAGLLLIAGIVAGVFIHKYLVSRQDADNKAAIITQNEDAYKQQLAQKADTIQNLAASVSDMHSKLTKAERQAGYWQAVAQNLQVTIDSIGSQGTGVPSTGEDSVGKYAEVQFGPDHRGITTMSGYTRYYFMTPTKTAYDWNAQFDEFEIRNSLYLDTDGIWKIKTTTSAPDVKFRSYSEIDSTIYIGLRQTIEGELARAKHYLPPFGLRLKAGVGFKSTIQIGSSNIGFPSNTLVFDGSAEAYYKNYQVTYYPAWGLWSAGLTYTVDISSIIEGIF